MSISKKHFKVIAAAIKEFGDDKRKLVNKLCYEFREFNPYFDSYKFREACGEED